MFYFPDDWRIDNEFDLEFAHPVADCTEDYLFPNTTEDLTSDLIPPPSPKCVEVHLKDFRPLSESSIILRQTFKGGRTLIYNGHAFHRNLVSGAKTYWRCAHASRLQCRARIVTAYDAYHQVTNGEHNHEQMARLGYGMGVNRVRSLTRFGPESKTNVVVIKRIPKP